MLKGLKGILGGIAVAARESRGVVFVPMCNLLEEICTRVSAVREVISSVRT